MEASVTTEEVTLTEALKRASTDPEILALSYQEDFKGICDKLGLTGKIRDIIMSQDLERFEEQIRYEEQQDAVEDHVSMFSGTHAWVLVRV